MVVNQMKLTFGKVFGELEQDYWSTPSGYTIWSRSLVSLNIVEQLINIFSCNNNVIYVRNGARLQLGNIDGIFSCKYRAKLLIECFSLVLCT